MEFLKIIHNNISRTTKILFLSSIDFLIIIFSLSISIFIIEEKLDLSSFFLFFLSISFISFLSLSYLLGIYRHIIRFIDVNFFLKINQLNILHFLIIFFFFHIAKKFFPNNEIYFSLFSTKQIFVHYLLNFLLFFLSRILISSIFNGFKNKDTILYLNNLNFDIKKFKNFLYSLDFENISKIYVNNESLINRSINNIDILDIKNFNLTIINSEITKKILFYGDFDQELFNKIVEKKISIFKISLNFGKAVINPIDISDLIGRKPIPPFENLFYSQYENKNVLVTGAGGSIGSEICRQLISCKIKNLIFLDISEFNIYQIIEEIDPYLNKSYLKFFIIDINDSDKIKNIILNYNIDIVFHAAAYKHVNLLEGNIYSAIKNNIMGTSSLINACLNTSVKNFTLISTDKAVNPSTIMGKTKRICEILVSHFQNQNNQKISFQSVRFGNVVESSGSVIPKFKKQIQGGGPVTVTNKRAVRFFMTIKEAAQLVMQSQSINVNGIIFLDMGSPKNIYDIAKKIILASGFSYKDEFNPDGEIEIIETGLRKGEKLTEKLFELESVEKTIHPRIFFIKDENLYQNFYRDILNSFENFHQKKPEELEKIIDSLVLK